jgi:hypothetical protein
VVVHQAGFAQPRRFGEHLHRGAVVAVPVENFPAAAQQFRFLNFFDWHYTERSYGKGKGVEPKYARAELSFLRRNIAPAKPDT